MQKLTYVTLDSIQEGVGESQVLAYVEQLSRTMQITLITFEKLLPNSERIASIERMNIDWRFILFGRVGLLGGFLRMLKLFQILPKDGLIHARSDVAAFTAILKGSKSVIWDCRALMADHRKALGTTRFSRLHFVCFRFMERIAAKKSKKIIVITEAVIPILAQRYKLPKHKFHHISTCVDIDKFTPNKSFDRPEPIFRILIAGTLSPAYDVKFMNDILIKLKHKGDIWVTVALGKNHDESWKNLVLVNEVLSVEHAEMPELIRKSHIGFAIWRNDFGIALKSVAATKVAEFLACGKPVLVNSLQGDYGYLVPKFDIGVSTQNYSIKELDRIISEIMRLASDPDLSRRCRTFAVKNYSLADATQSLTQVYSEVQS